MKKFKFSLFAVALTLLTSCGEKKAETQPAPPSPATTEATAPPAAAEVKDTVAAAIETATQELEKKTTDFKNALKNIQ